MKEKTLKEQVEFLTNSETVLSEIPKEDITNFITLLEAESEEDQTILCTDIIDGISDDMLQEENIQLLFNSETVNKILVAMI